MTYNDSHSIWLNYREDPDFRQNTNHQLIGLLFAATYFFGMLIGMEWAREKVSRHALETSYIIPPCVNRRCLHPPIIFLWPGLLWPIFLVYVCVKQRRRRQRADGLVENDANNGIRLNNIGNNQEAEPLPPSPPPAYQSMDYGHHNIEQRGEIGGNQIQRERRFV